MDLVMVDPWLVEISHHFFVVYKFGTLAVSLSLSLCLKLYYRCVGYHSEADLPSRRLAKPLIFCRTESECPMENGYARPVEGIHVLVDLQNMVILEFEDRKFVPLPSADPLRNYTSGETRGGNDRSDVKPLHILQPEGPSFRVDGYFVRWQKVYMSVYFLSMNCSIPKIDTCYSSIDCLQWNFRVGFTPREGLVLYSVAYLDGSRGRRSVAHRLSFVEMVVPYGDPHEPHYRKNAFDAGEDGLGKNAHSLKKVKNLFSTYYSPNIGANLLTSDHFFSDIRVLPGMRLPRLY